MLVGTFYNQIDDKGRLVIPAKFREELGGDGAKCALTRSLDKCLVLYSWPEWEKQVAALQTLPKNDDRARRILRHIIGPEDDVKPDKQSRILCKEDLRKYAQISGEIVIVGMIDRIEIWSRDVYETFDDSVQLKQDEKELSREYRF